MRHVEPKYYPENVFQNSYLEYLGLWQENTKSFIKKKPLLLNFFLVLLKKTIYSLNSIKRQEYASLAGVTVLALIALAFLSISEAFELLTTAYVKISESIIYILTAAAIISSLIISFRKGK